MIARGLLPSKPENFQDCKIGIFFPADCGSVWEGTQKFFFSFQSTPLGKCNKPKKVKKFAGQVCQNCLGQIFRKIEFPAKFSQKIQIFLWDPKVP